MKPKIVIESGIPAPVGKRIPGSDLDILRQAIAGLKKRQSFVWPNSKSPHKAAADLGLKVQTRKEDGKGHRVWRRE